MNDVCTVTDNPKRNKIREERQTVITPRSHSSVLFLFTMDSLRLIKSKGLVWEREQVIVSRDVPNSLSLVLLRLSDELLNETRSITEKDGDLMWHRISNVTRVA